MQTVQGAVKEQLSGVNYALFQDFSSSVLLLSTPRQMCLREYKFFLLVPAVSPSAPSIRTQRLTAIEITPYLLQEEHEILY